MADTIRTLNYLLTTLFQDGQPASSITAQDMRDLLVSAFGDYSKTGGAAGWKDFSFQLVAGKAGAGVTPPDFVKFRDNGAGSAGVFEYAFDQSAEESLFSSFVVAHDYKEGTPFYPFLVWSPGNSTNTGVVRWGLEWTAQQGHSQGAFPVTTFTYIEQAASGVAYKNQTATVASPGITIPGAEPGMKIIARVFRDATHVNDTFTGDAFAFDAGGHYQTDHHSTKNKEPPFYS